MYFKKIFLGMHYWFFMTNQKLRLCPEIVIVTKKYNADLYESAKCFEISLKNLDFVLYIDYNKNIRQCSGKQIWLPDIGFGDFLP